MILFTTIHLFAHTQIVPSIAIITTIQFWHTEIQVLLCNSNYSIKHQLFIYTLVNDQTVLFLTIRLNVIYLFANSSNR